MQRYTFFVNSKYYAEIWNIIPNITPKFGIQFQILRPIRKQNYQINLSKREKTPQFIAASTT